jgi:hypothetical protein
LANYLVRLMQDPRGTKLKSLPKLHSWKLVILSKILMNE